MQSCAQPTEPRTYYGAVLDICRCFSAEAVNVLPTLLDRPIADPSAFVPHAELGIGAGNFTTLRQAIRLRPDLNVEDFIPDIVDHRRQLGRADVLRTIPRGRTVLVGNPAIYYYVHLLDAKHDRYLVPDAVDTGRATSLAEHIVSYTAVGDYDTVFRGAARARKFKPVGREKRLIGVAYGLKRIFDLCNLKSNRAIVRDSEKAVRRILLGDSDVPARFPAAKVGNVGFSQRFFRSGEVLVVDLPSENRTLLLRSKDVGDVQRTLLQLGIYENYSRCYAEELSDAETRANYLGLRDGILARVRTLISIAKGGGSAANLVGVYFSVLTDQLDGHLAGSELVPNEDRVAGKFSEKGLGCFPRQDDLVRLAKRVPAKERLDLCICSKFSCYPEYCPYGAAVRQIGLYSEARKAGGAPGSDAELLYQELRTFTRARRIERIRVLTGGGIFPGKPRVPDDGVAPAWHKEYARSGLPSWRDANDIDLTGVLKFSIAQESALLRQHDSSLAPSDPKLFGSEEALRGAPARSRNSLCWMLEEESPQSIEETMEAAQDEAIINDCLSGIRLERGKGDGRLFFQFDMANRMMFSNWEANVEVELGVMKENMLGTSVRTKLAMLRQISELLLPPEMTLLESTDLEKFSPKMSRRFQEDRAAEDAEIYGDDRLAKCRRPMLDCRLSLRAYGYLLKIRADGPNFEGMDGKRNTMSHGDIKAFIQWKCYDAGITSRIGKDACFIDDAASRKYLGAMGFSREDARTATRAAIAISDAVYQSASWKESVDKSYRSGEYVIMLAERIFFEQPLRQGIKAALAWGDVREAPVVDFSEIYSRNRGIARGVPTNSGLLDWSVYFATLFTLLDANRLSPGYMKWLTAADFALLAVTPTRLTGLGMTGALTLDSNVAGGDTQMGLTILTNLPHFVPSAEDAVDRILNAPLEEIDDLQWMRNCDYFSAVGSKLRPMKTKRACLDLAMTKAKNPWLLELVKYADEAQEREIAKRWREKRNVVKADVDAYWKTTYLSQVESLMGKFSASEKLVHVLGKDKLNALRREARREFSDVVGGFKSRVTGG